MKKLMLTTAIASVMTTVAIAQTTITGELRVSYKDVAANKALTPATAGTPDTAYGFGVEQQINVQNKGKLPFGGIEYAGGFAMENDGEQTSTLFNENTYMDFTNPSTGTTISFSRDHIQRSDSDRSAAGLLGFSVNELSTTGAATNAGTWFPANIGAQPGQNFGAAILQKTPFGTFSYLFVPNNASPISGTVTPTTTTAGLVSTTGTGILVTDATLVGLSSSEAVNNNTTAAYEYGFTGDLGVKGLAVHYFKNANNDYQQRYSNGAFKAEGKNYGASYNFGQFTAGVNRKVHNAEANTLAETTETQVAAAYAVDKDLSIGVIRAKADRNTASTENQTLKAVQLGYALGPVDLAVAYAKNENAAGIAGADVNVFMARLIGKF